MNIPIYLDCNATTPMDPLARDAVIHWFSEEVGNQGSRTHEFGLRAKKAVQRAREQVSSVVCASTDEILFTSGATESNNMAILGLARFGQESGKKHLVTTAIEHKSVLEPVESLSKLGFEITVVPPDIEGVISPEAICSALRPDTLLVSVMHVNNETGVSQPIKEISGVLDSHSTFFHVDAAQGFGKDLNPLRSKRIDMISISSHKIYGPVGVGALVVRRRGYDRLPLAPLAFGGGQERGLRPGTLPTALIVGFGIAAKNAESDATLRAKSCLEIRQKALESLNPLGIRLHGDQKRCLPHVLNFSVDGVDSEAFMLAVKDVVAVSNGSACTSQSYEPSHVLAAMNLPESAIAGAVRLSWSHLTPEVDWSALANRIQLLL